VFDWFEGRATVAELIARGKYGRAEKQLREEFKAGRREPELRLQLADVLVLGGREKAAVPIYVGVADELARLGQGGRAIGVLKKIEKLEPGREDVARRLAALIAEKGKNAGTVPAAELEPHPAPTLGLELEAERQPRPEVEPEPEPPAPSPSPLPASPLFGDFSGDDLLALMERLSLLTFEAGDIVVGDGQDGGSLFFITSGRVKAFVRTPTGGYAQVRELGQGDFFGEISLLAGGARTAMITAAERSEMLELDRETVVGLAAARPGIRDVLRRFAAERVGDAPA
jgi:cAMP-dependent protein kinase regulator